MNLEFGQQIAKSDTVSRRRYDRATKARQEAETLLDAKSRELWDANQKLIEQAENLEKLVTDRTVELEAAMVAAQTANKAKSVFLASMSHEIRTPLNGVLGMAEALLDTRMDGEQKNMANTIVDSGQLLLSVLNDILDISKIEAGQLEIEDSPFKLSELFRSVEKLYSMKAAEKSLALSLSMTNATDQWVSGDALRLRQIAGNLISNAIKFTQDGRVDVRVDLKRIADTRFQLAFEVQDTGEGIPEDKLDRLFKPFSQVDSSVARRYGGTGLGLSISKQICELMGGDISVESTVDEGSVFRVIVSLKPAQTAINKSDVKRDVDGVLKSRTWRVLLAEDNRTNQIVFKKFLKSYDIDIMVAENGRKAVEAFETAKFDIIFMDVNMPEMDGIEATKLIRSIEEKGGLKPLPIIALTANTMTHQVEDYLANGIDKHLGKPIKKAVLLDALADMLSERVTVTPR